MTQNEKEEVIQRLRERGVHLNCPRCNNRNFSLIDGYFHEFFQPNLGGAISIGGQSIPSIGTVCTRCGFISFHAVGVLGINFQSGAGNSSGVQNS